MTYIVVLLFVFLAFSCSNKSTINNKAGIDPASFNRQIDGKTVELLVLKNKDGLEITLTNYGGRVVSWLTPDRAGNFEDITVGFDNLDDYLTSENAYLGAVIGRFANVINKGKFHLNGKMFSLALNNNKNHFNGGYKGLNSVVWDVTRRDSSSVELHYFSKDMEEGYPGNLDITMNYSLTDSNEFVITYHAKADKPTPVNLTHSSYFNLNGAGNENINDHILYVNADFYTPKDKGLIPTGEISPVIGTVLDFTSPRELVTKPKEQFYALKDGKVYNQYFVLNQQNATELMLAASIYAPQNGRCIQVFTDQPGVHITGSEVMNDKRANGYSNISIQAQSFPDSPNKPNFPNTILMPGEQYAQTCIYKFSLR